MRHAIRVAILAMAAGCAASALAGEAERTILDESGVWRRHMTWMRAVVKTEQGVKPARIWNQMSEDGDPPAPDWMQPEFDDSSWAYWREPFLPENLKLKDVKGALVPSADGTDTGVPLYRPGQYGACRSLYLGLQCFRGRFKVDDPAKAGKLSFAAEYRGGLAVYVNGKEVARAHLPKDGPIEPGSLADGYPAEAFVDPKAVTPKGSKTIWVGEVPMDAGLIKRYNARIRRTEVEIPVNLLRKGVNVLAVAIHRAPCAPDGQEKPDDSCRWNTCGPVRFRLACRGGGASSSIERPKGLQVWNACPFTRISPFGFCYGGRVYQGAGVFYERFPLSWGDPNEPLSPVRLVGARNAVCMAQLGVGCDRAIKGLKASAGDLARKGGTDRIAGSSVELLYMVFPDEPYRSVEGPSVSFIDALYETAPPEVPARAAGKTGSWTDATDRRALSQGTTTWIDVGAAAAIWVRARIPRDTPAGDYEGALTVTAEGASPVTAPLRVTVADWTVPDPRDWVAHVGTPHSPDTLAIWYKTQPWSDAHWQMVEKTLSYMGQLGSKAVFLPLRARTAWFNNEQSYVYWVKQADGSFAYDYRVFDRYMDLVQKHLKPETYCLYAVDFCRRGADARYSLLDPGSGKVDCSQGPEYKPTSEATAFWKPVFDGVIARLAKRGVKPESITLGMDWEGAGSSPEALAERIALFKEVIPGEMRLAQIAHYGGTRKAGPVEYGYSMSVWSGRKIRFQAKQFGGRDIPMLIVKHYRADGVLDLRPTAHRGALHLCVEEALKELCGVGPLGMDFWWLPADAASKRREGFLEGGGADNLSMSAFSTCALLAPGPRGPISTARYEVLRQGLQECEARMGIERALADKDLRGKLGAPLAKRCEETLKERDRVFSFVKAGGWADAEGWVYYEGSGWENRTHELFSCAGDVARALK